MNPLLSNESVSLRKAIFLATGIGLTAAGCWLMWQHFKADGVSWLEWTLLALFLVLFGQLAFGFSIAFWGFVTWLRGGDALQIMRTLPDKPGPNENLGATAIAMPVYNEDCGRVFRGLEAMITSLERTGHSESFDFFILSDSNQPDQWIAEERAWVDLCSRLQKFGNVFYRKRRVSLHGKSGNINDFCRRWGKRYRYLVILDADSIMSGETLVRLTRAMDENPRTGIIQTAPKMVGGASFLQRLWQFSTSVVGPIFAAGSSFWHLAGGSYWGHNAIIRLKPFMAHCILPELPVQKQEKRHIMSHDTVEAALMQQAGFEVWLANEEPGSYEECPPNLTENLKRDRRWCQGNLQHFWFLFAPATFLTNRIHILFGLLAYLSAPLLVLFITLSLVDYYWKQRYATLAAQSPEPFGVFSDRNSLLLLILTLGLLFLPKILGTITALVRPSKFGGFFRLFASTLLEAILSILLAPILLYYHTKFVVLTTLGVRVAWKTQNRSDLGIGFGEAASEYGQTTLAGFAVIGLCAWFVPNLIWWLAPIFAGWVLSIPLVMLTASTRVGLWLRKLGLLVTPEEVEPPVELHNLEGAETVAGSTPQSGLEQVIIAPDVNAIHLSLLQRSKQGKKKSDLLAAVRRRLLEEGPESISRREIMALLWNAESVEAVHRELWKTPHSLLHPAWRHAMDRWAG
ncbi:MAG TPA: glucans biosynthesis glucosyltransferase MdoH [Chthoniobacterales bacterium]